MRTRRAVSVLELVVIMSASTVVLTLTGVLLHRAMRIQMQSRAQMDAERTSLRLANQFRRDAHAARAAVALQGDENGGAFLRLEFANGRTVEYSRLAGTVRRLESGGSKPAWREEFLFPAINELRIDQASAPRRLTMTVVAKPVEQPSKEGKPLAATWAIPLSIHAEAILGRDLRFDPARAGEKESP
jgi:hypothetical protein